MTGLPNGIRFVRFVETIQEMIHGEVVGVEKKEVMIITTCKEEVSVESLLKMIYNTLGYRKLYHRAIYKFHLN